MYNNYLGNNQYAQQYYPNYMPNYNYQQTPIQQDSPMELKFGTLDEAKAYIVPPTKSVMFIDKDKSEFYVKTADNMGKSVLEEYKYSKTINNPTETNSFNLDGFLKREEASLFATKEDIANINARLEEISKNFNVQE